MAKQRTHKMKDAFTGKIREFVQVTTYEGDYLLIDVAAYKKAQVEMARQRKKRVKDAVKLIESFKKPG